MLTSSYTIEYDEPTFTHSFPFPTIYEFPPFFIRQHSERTWHSQLVNWNSLILAYCRYYRIYTLDLSRTSSTNNNNDQNDTKNSNKPRGEIDGELFWNRKINRALQLETIKAVFEFMVMHGDAVWLDSSDANVSNGSNNKHSNGNNSHNDKSPIGEYNNFNQQGYQNWSTNTNNNIAHLSPQASNASCILVYWRQPEEWANMLAEWVSKIMLQ